MDNEKQRKSRKSFKEMVLAALLLLTLAAGFGIGFILDHLFQRRTP